MKTYTLWAVQANEDTCEGRGRNRDILYTSDQATGLQIVKDPTFYKQYGVQGCIPYKNGMNDVVNKIFNVFESFEEYQRSVDTEIKIQKALSKLTDEEKKLLGL